MCILGTLSAALLLRIAGYLVAAYALLKAKPSGRAFSAGAVSLGLACFLGSSQAGWVSGAAMLSVACLLMAEQLGISQGRLWLQSYWFIPAAVYCVYLVMFCVESFSALSFILEGLTGCALALAMREFALPKNAAS